MIAFLFMAAVIYFFIVKPVNAIRARQEVAEPEENEVNLLAEIRDLIKTQNGGTTPAATTLNPRV